MAKTWCMYSPKMNILYINSYAILPNTNGMSNKEAFKATKQAFDLSYEERIERYATDEQKAQIREALAEHPDCEISEYMNA